jgi:chaperonin GroES
VVVRRDEPETTSRGGIIIPDAAAEKSTRGTVIAAGPGTAQDNGEVRPLAVQVGDQVLFNKYVSSEITIDGEELLIIRESDIIAVIEADAQMEKAA